MAQKSHRAESPARAPGLRVTAEGNNNLLRVRIRHVIAVIGILSSPLLRAQDLQPGPLPSPTQAPPGARYAGSAVCAKCHTSQASQLSTPMARALEPAADCAILRAHPRLTFRAGAYSYEITRHGNTTTYTVTDGHANLSELILWAFGLGEAGQTYVFKHNGSYYESRVSFFNDTQRLDFTLGASRSVPTSLDEAAGRVMHAADEQACFGCHSTGGVSGSHLEVERMTPGVICESCHGPGAEHVAAVRAGNPDPRRIFNPGKLRTGDLADFCGSCHRSWIQVELMHLKSIQNVRFQPYRLALSKCFEQDDLRISCLACHDPHQNVKRVPASYDAKCLACHPSSAGRAPSAGPRHDASGASLQAKQVVAPACPIAKRSCVTCHMPKYSLPGAHFKFTDHRIRVVQPKEPYPG
ncbi:MAG: hypothetical protein DMG24_02965 [Acidobacteria bacterium]|nr:MAG: hypothetical protein DMG24_02965 [Acidobacteriota bacterium]